MKRTLLSTLTITLALAASSFAQAPQQAMTTSSNTGAAAGGFIGVDAGLFWLQDFSVNSGPLGVDFKFKTDWGITVPVGYAFDNGLLLSASIGYYETRLDGVTGKSGGRSQTAQINGGFDFLPLMANLGYKINLGGGFNWILGAGAGGVYSKGTFSSYDNPGNRSISYGQLGQTAFFDGLSDTNWSFGFTAFTGLSFDITPAMSANVGYRYLHVNDNVSVNGQSSSDFNGQSVELGLSWKL